MNVLRLGGTARSYQACITSSRFIDPNPIKGLSFMFDVETEEIVFPQVEPETPLSLALRSTCLIYGDVALSKLLEIVHDPVWRKARSEGMNTPIDPDDIRRYFRKQMTGESLINPG